MLYGNCQVLFIHAYLKKNFPQYEYYYLCNWQAILDSTPFPIEKIKQADIFIYQPLLGYGKLDTDYLLKHVQSKCNCISCPYLYFLGYFPDSFRSGERNEKTKSPNFPFGYFPAAQKKLDELIMMGYPLEEVIERSRRDDFLSPDFIWEKFHYSLQILKEREAFTDVKLADFIEKHYAKELLFQSPCHPTTRLFKELIKQVLVLMNLPVKDIKRNVMFQKEPDLLECPLIYPCVAKTLNLEFSTEEKIMCVRKNVSYATYIQEYMRHLFPEFYRKPN